MQIYEQVIARWKEEERLFDLMEYISAIEPTTPKDTTIEMGRFNINKVRNAIIWNIYFQQHEMEYFTVEKLLNFLENDFTDITKQIYGQILVHVTKMDPNLIQWRIKEQEKIPAALLYNKKLVSYLDNANKLLGRGNIIKEVESEQKENIQNLICQNLILKSLLQSLRMVTNRYEETDVINAVKKMEIYQVNTFLPIPELRGACVMKGILYCSNVLAQPEESDSHLADKITILSHETSHYLNRLFNNDFNTSSPHTRGLFEEMKKFDPVYGELPLELGRATELHLFDGFQPSWKLSTAKAAKTFLKRLKLMDQLPVIRKEEMNELGLMHRSVISIGFALDEEEEDESFE